MHFPATRNQRASPCGDGLRRVADPPELGFRGVVAVEGAMGVASRGGRGAGQLASFTLMPTADRLNRRPTSVECSVMTTPCSFLR